MYLELVDLGFLGVYWGRVQIETNIATKEEEINEGIEALMYNTSNRNRFIGLDMIPIPVAPESSSSGKTSNAILQLCDSTQCLIVRLHSSHDVPKSLYSFLKTDYGFVCKNVLEVGTAMWRTFECNRHSLRESFSYMRIPESISKPWGNNFKLTEDEIKLAVSNSFYAFRIAGIMHHS